MAGFQAASSAWKNAQFPLTELNWDTYDARMVRYWFNEAYYHNIAYDSINRYASRYKHEYGLYRHIRPVYNPSHRYPDIRVAKTYPGAIDFEAFADGALPFTLSNDTLIDPIRNLLMWSNWGNNKDLYVRTGTKLGDSFIKVTDDPFKRKVRMEVLNPQFVKFVRKDDVGNIKEIHIEYERLDYDKARLKADYTPVFDNQTYTYTEVYAPDANEVLTLTTYKDGAEHAFYADMSGELVSSWTLPYGFVPVVHALDVDEGLMFGATGLNGARAKIDEINDQASKLNDQIRKVIHPIWAVIGGKASNVAFDELERDEMPMIGLPEGTDLKAVVADLNIDSVLKNLDSMLMELERDVPVLSLHRLKSLAGNISGLAVRNLFDDAISQLENGQAAFDAPFIRAVQMGLTIGGMGGYDGFGGISENSYANGDLEMYLRTRPAFEDKLAKVDRLNMWMQSGAPNSKVWEELGASQKEINDWTQEAEEQEAAQEASIVDAVNRLKANPVAEETEANADSNNASVA
jgi:hypothetical protein